VGNNVVGGFSLATVCTGIAAGDWLGINIQHNAIGGALNYLGLELIYN
jgi:hypothetical protein